MKFTISYPTLAYGIIVKYWLDRYVRSKRVWSLSRFRVKLEIAFDHFGLECMVFRLRCLLWL